jgi:acyl-CoA synthetase (AMP-forming)/AMP-acid ligase II
VARKLKDVIIIRGRNYYPQDIEQTVQQSHPALAVGSGAAFIPNLNSGYKLTIVQEVEQTYLRKLNIPELLSNIRQAVADEHGLQISAIALVKPGSLPKTSSGEIQRFDCREAFLSGTLHAEQIYFL